LAWSLIFHELLTLEAREQNLRERMDALETRSHAYAHLHRFLWRIRAALERLISDLFGAKLGRC